MKTLNWLIQTSPEKANQQVYSEYVLNGLGIFVKREKRVAKKAPFMALTGFRIGFKPVAGTDYRAAPLDRNVILWHKLTSAVYQAADKITARGNQTDVIEIKVPPELLPEVMAYIDQMRQQIPPVIDPDRTAASWICWRDDDEWTDPLMPLAAMIEEEKANERYIDPEVLEETRLGDDVQPFSSLLGLLNH